MKRRCQIQQRCALGQAATCALISAHSRPIESRSGAMQASPFPKLYCGKTSSRIATVRWAARSCLLSFAGAITVDARVKPDYTGIRVPVLAIYRVDPPSRKWPLAI